ncbi:hypothetical protein L3Q82_007092 [Scortum barcoo]|uniref:Uncharacterized protein n=1 Tax=Scortum barcoo TaxID=214431 RepID=A0ACB8WTB6_9TELE|nr:hypothetical protein L3Q82_007092 [Scortum barcoo]
MSFDTHIKHISSSCTALNRKALQREVKAAQHITRTELPSMEDLYTQRYRKKATKIIKDPSHPATNCSACLPSGRRFCSIRARTTRLRPSEVISAGPSVLSTLTTRTDQADKKSLVNINDLQRNSNI